MTYILVPKSEVAYCKDHLDRMIMEKAMLVRRPSNSIWLPSFSITLADPGFSLSFSDPIFLLLNFSLGSFLHRHFNISRYSLQKSFA